MSLLSSKKTGVTTDSCNNRDKLEQSSKQGVPVAFVLGILLKHRASGLHIKRTLHIT